MKIQHLILSVVFVAANAFAAPNENPFVPFFGEYEQVEAECYHNSEKYTEGCYVDKLIIKQNDTKFGGKEDIHLIEERGGRPFTHELLKRSVNVGSAGLFSWFSSRSK